MQVYILKDEDGNLQPMAFICPIKGDGLSEYRVNEYKTSRFGKDAISKGAIIVKAELTEL